MSYAYFYQGGDPNQATRLLLTHALVERHAPNIDRDSPLTIDKASRDGHFYSDKAPGVSLLAVVPYAALSAVERVTGLDPRSRPVERAGFHTLVFLIAGLSGVLATAMVRRSVELLGASSARATLVAFGYALGTLAFPFSTVLFSHEVAAAILVTSFALCLAQRRTAAPASRAFRLGLGAIWALAIIVEYPSAIPVAILGLYFLWGEGRLRRVAGSLAWTVLGALPVLALHGALMAWEFGSPFDVPYRYVSDAIFRAHTSSGILGVGRPHLAVLVRALVGPYRGLLFFCPLLVLVPAGFAAWTRRGGHASEGVVCAAIVVFSLLFTAGYYAWDGDFSTGPRHLVATLPFFAIPIGQLARGGKWSARSLVALTIPSVAIMLVSTAVLVQSPKGDPSTMNPLYASVLPALARGDVGINPLDPFHDTWQRDAAYNLGTLFGLGAWASLLVLVLAWGLAYASDVVPRRAPA